MRDTTAAAKSLTEADNAWLQEVALRDPDMIRDVAAALIHARSRANTEPGCGAIDCVNVCDGGEGYEHCPNAIAAAARSNGGGSGNQCQNQAPIKVRCKCGWEGKSDQLTGRVQSQDLYCPRCGEKFISYPANVVGAATPSASLEVTAEAFTAWWHEVENFSLRSERAIDDMRNDARYFLPRWMRAAFDAGARAAQARSAAPPPNLEPQCGVGEHCRFCLTYPNPSSPATCKTMQEASKCPWHSQAASAAVPKPIDDGAVEREPWLTLKAIAEFPVADPNNISAINMAQMAKRGLDHLRRAALQVSQTK